MSYIESQLLPNERIVARTARNWIVLLFPVLLAAAKICRFCNRDVSAAPV